MVDDVSGDLGLTEAAAGLLTSLPVLCFAVATPLVSTVIARLGVERVVSLSLGLIAVGTVVRSSGGYGLALAGTVLIGIAIAAGNVAVPLVVQRDFHGTSGTVTGLYSAALNVGAVVTTAATAPLADAVGWRWALAAWAVLVPLAYVPWRLAVRRRARWRAGSPEPGARGPGVEQPGPAPAEAGDESPETAAPASVLRRPLTWLLVAMFAGHTFGYYGITAWLPSILHDTIGVAQSAAGGAASLFSLTAIAGAVGVPIAATRGTPPRVTFVVVAALWLSLPVGLALAPALWPVWVCAAGVAQGGNYTVIVSVIVQRTGDLSASRRTSTAVQSLGYVAGACGPVALGAVHTATGGWTAPLVCVVGALGAMTLAGLVVTRPARR
ncbi:CynX/NimT family MFS transporter [Cellulomonas sp. PhB143]|uniref:MFS transporter n=1 Tax=Cellulomonas sp. PhB143 TaxID=2485186 RepID=UPI000F9B9EFE|nr:MFS transporter [Cellulomonas sp. PhB143]ROS78699.1 CP family cyanate transporter-like MFS transporter [Cellulomonas sp. PhB143]